MPEQIALSKNDPGSYANSDQAIVTHMDIKMNCDLNNKIIKGQVLLTVKIIAENVNSVAFDTRDLEILKVFNNADQSTLEYTLGEPISMFGSKLMVQLPSLYDKEIVIGIDYTVGENASALQWLSPKQTSGNYPYLFTQCQPDHCRSILPCQDTPTVKSTYTAQITVPAELTAVASALSDGEPLSKENGTKEFKFYQPVPVPAYLIAFAVGNLESRQVGPRSHVWAEPEIIQAAAYEFGEVETLLKIAEDICGPYVWQKYDILVLPPSFPFGGMENPCLTFLTPTLLVGDRSLIDVAAHEIAHSWTGNLVSIINFEHFWLNEGFTMFIERKILGRLNGEEYRHFSAIGGLKDLKNAIKVFGEENPLTKLVVDLKGIDPDEAFSTCPYEKGHTFLFYLEQLAGGNEIFELFLRSYFQFYKYKSVETDDFKNYLYEYFNDNEELNKVDWGLWLNTPGMPPIIPEYNTSLQVVCSDLIKRWVDWQEKEPIPFGVGDLEQFLPKQIEEFTALLLQLEGFPLSKLRVMDNIYKMTSYKNPEIRFRWIRICIKARWDEKVDDAFEFVTSTGRMKYVRPICRDLYEWEKTKDRVVQWYRTHRSSMMQVLRHGLENDLHLINKMSST